MRSWRKCWIRSWLSLDSYMVTCNRSVSLFFFYFPVFFFVLIRILLLQERMFLRPFTRRIWPRGCLLGKVLLWMPRNQCYQSWSTVRLIHQSSTHENALGEKNQPEHPHLCDICDFSSECGAAFTSKLEGMFKDMELSKDIMVQFKQVRPTNLAQRTCERFELMLLCNDKQGRI